MERNPAFDGVRALAVLVVMAMHARLPVVPGGFIGVDVFFVLSGFLITRLLARELSAEGRIDMPRFLLRRLLRLTPPLALMLLAYVALAPHAWPHMPASVHVRDAALSALYLSDLTVALTGAPTAISHTWSLSVEEHFYLVWPFLLVVIFRCGALRRRLAALILAFGLATAWRVANVVQGSDWPMVYYRFDTHLTGLLLGAAVALLESDRVPKRAADALALASLAVLGASCVHWAWEDAAFLIWGQTAVECAAAALVLALAGESGLTYRALSVRPLALIGLVSYSVYLWHYPIARHLREWMDPQQTFVIVLAASLVIAAVSWRLVEAPIAATRRTPSSRVVADRNRLAPL